MHVRSWLDAELVAFGVLYDRVVAMRFFHGGPQPLQPFDLDLDRARRPKVEVHPVLGALGLGALTAMTADDFDAPSWTPVGDATYGRLMQVRVFDCWMHEQDIRTAVGAGGHEDGDAARQSLDEVVRALGYIIGKCGGAPDGCCVLISLSGPIRRDLHVVVQGRARVVDALEGAPTASLTLSSSLFLRLAGGRQDAQAALAQIELGGDVDLARQLATNLAFTM